jgi:hypothetical protein
MSYTLGQENIDCDADSPANILPLNDQLLICPRIFGTATTDNTDNELYSCLGNYEASEG